MTLLLTAVLGLMSLTDSAAKTTASTKAREGAVNLAREVLEGAGGIPYTQISSSGLVPTLQGLPGLASETGGSWTLTRRNASGGTGFKYSVDATLCSIDDASDGYGSHSDASFCAGTAAPATQDSQPEDFKRVAVTVSWTANGRTYNVRQSTLLAKNGAPDLPVVNSLVLTTPVVATPATPTISSNATSATFTATATSTASAVKYSVDGVDMGTATQSGGNWTFTLDISDASRWSDGAYTIGARALNAGGIPGPTRTLTLTLARRTPAAPAGLVGGRNSVTKNGSVVPVAEFDWLPNSERNVLGYRVYRPGGSLACPGTAQTLDLKTSCIDFAPADGVYSVVAVYRDAGGVLREGPASTVTVNPLTAPTTSFYFENTTGFTGSNCATADGQRDADDAYAGSASDSSFSFAANVLTLNFCTRRLKPADSSVTGTSKVYAWATNTGTVACSMTVNLRLNGGPSAASAVVSVPQGTTSAAAFVWSLSTSSFAFATGDRMDVYFTTAQGSSCNRTDIFFGGTTRRSRLDLPNPGQGVPPGTPSPPTGLSGTANADGSKTLNWTAPSGGNPVSFYRIYRDGIEYTQRYDSTGDASTTYTDPSGDGIAHSYYVAAVGPNLQESSPVGPVTP